MYINAEPIIHFCQKGIKKVIVTNNFSNISKGIGGGGCAHTCSLKLYIVK